VTGRSGAGYRGAGEKNWKSKIYPLAPLILAIHYPALSQQNENQLKTRAKGRIGRVLREEKRQGELPVEHWAAQEFKQVDLLHFSAIAEEFLAQYLGGQFEPVGEIEGHSGVVVETSAQ
jgi:hypothetical protein